MFETILLSVDMSEDSEKALRLTSQLAAAHHSRVVVVHGREAPLVNPAGRTTPPRIGGIETEDAAQSLVDSAVSTLREAGVQARGRVFSGQGRIGQHILEAISREDADLVVLGSRGMSRLEEAMIGSVSNKIVRESKVPVLLAR